MKIKYRIAIWLGEVCLTFIALYALHLGYDIAAGVAIGGIVGTLPKLVESEEKGQ